MTNYRARSQSANNDRSLLEFVRDSVGAGNITTKRVYNVRHSPSFAYKVSNRQALDLLSQVARYLQTYRRKRAAMALERYLEVTPRNGKYGAEILRMKSEFERDFLGIGPGPRYRPR